MIRFFIIFELAIFASAYVAPGEITRDTFKSGHLRISSGEIAKKGENLDFCYISINFFQKRQSCGCFILSPYYVMTSARCVVDCSEKTATNVTVTFPQKSGKDSLRRVIKIYVPDGINGNLPKYDEGTDIPIRSFHAGSNIAVLLLDERISFGDNNAKRSTIVVESTMSELMATAAKFNHKFRTCGIGTINNQGEYSKGVICADVDVNDGKNGACKVPHNAFESYTLPDTFACLQWPTLDRNLCVDDYGGPVWIYQLDPEGKAINQEVFCIPIGSPDVRINAPCLDGHTVYCQYITSPILNWARSIYGP